MQRGRGALLHLTHRKALEDVQCLQQHDAPRRRLRHRDDVVTAIGAADRRADDRLIRFEIVKRHDAAGVTNRLHQSFGDRPLVKPARPLFGNRRKRRRQVGLHKPVAFAQRATIGAGKDLCRRGPARQPPMPIRQRVGDVIGDCSAGVCQRNPGLDQFGKREIARAVFIEREGEPCDGTGHADAERGIA